MREANDHLDPGEERFLLALARRSIEKFLKTGTRLRPEAGSKKLSAERGAFVTLKVDDELRGCIGYPLPRKPLIETVAEMAVAAATQDYRFPPLRIEELPRTKIEISVLTLPTPVKEVKEIEVGRHGIIISKGLSRGLLLPQVPGEYGWDLKTYLRHGCLKAGLEEDEWKKDARIEVFEAQVFSE
ncbi:MAG: AmmeMemoRadiSam system protein A [Candidatus Aminicenantes bacterium]|nr:AmmeMemoRadiSam system protein A [Candidatus Aminicenantes bacterium]